MKDRTPWLDALKQNIEKKPTKAHKNAAGVFAGPENSSSESLAQHTDKTDRSLVSHDEPMVRAALLELFEEDREWQHLFRSCCETSIYRLMAQAWQFRDELKDRGHTYPVEEVEDVLLSLARELLPESAAAHWDSQWAHELCKDALARLAIHYAGLSAAEKESVELSAQGVWDGQMVAAAPDNDPAAFRAALKGWERAGLEAIKRVGVKGGAA